MVRQKNLPRRHHFVPQMILRNFTADDGRLCYHQRDWEEGKIVRVKPNDVFFERDLYTRLLADGSKDVSIELTFSKIESVAANFIGQLCAGVRQGNTITMNDGAWNFWFHLVKRTPGYMNAITDNPEFYAVLAPPVRLSDYGQP